MLGTLGGRHQRAELHHPVWQAGQRGQQQVQAVRGLHRRGEHDGALPPQLLPGQGSDRAVTGRWGELGWTVTAKLTKPHTPGTSEQAAGAAVVGTVARLHPGTAVPSGNAAMQRLQQQRRPAGQPPTTRR